MTTRPPSDNPGARNVVRLRRIDSTNRLARRIVDEYSREDLVLSPVALVAHEQSAGRGRQGKVWSSPRGEGIYATLLLPGFEDVARLPVVVPVLLAEALNDWLRGECRIKWPNDLVVDRSKLAGILIETVRRGEASGAALVGFGVNHGAEISATPGATSLTELLGAGCPTLDEVSSKLIGTLWRGLAESRPAGRMVERYRRLLVHRPGEELRVRIGSEEIVGRFEGTDEASRLLLRVEGELRAIAAGEVFEL